MNCPAKQIFLAFLLLSLSCVATAQVSTQGGGAGKPVGPPKTSTPTDAEPMTLLPGAAGRKEAEKSTSSTPSRASTKPATVRQVQQTPRPLTKTLTIKEKGITIQHPDGWTVASKRLQNLDELVYVSPDVTAKQAVSSMKITSETRRGHSEAIRRLKEVAFGIGAPATSFQIIGHWPGFQYRRIEERPQPGEGEGLPRFVDEKVLRITTAVAVGNLLVRVEAALPSDADPGLISEAESMGRSLTFAAKRNRPDQGERELEEIRSNPRPDNVESAGEKPKAAENQQELTPLTTTLEQNLPAPGFTQRIFNGGNGELEIAVSPNARNIVIGRQSAFSTSNDGGQTFPFSGFIPFSGGDPSLAWGQSGNFYYAGIRGGCLPADATGPNGYTCSGVARSTNNGQTFPTIFNANRCPNNNATTPPNLPGFCFPVRNTLLPIE